MKRLVHFITALLIVPNTASARQIQNSIFAIAKEQNRAHFILDPMELRESCSIFDSENFEVVRASGGYFVERTHVVMRSAKMS